MKVIQSLNYNLGFYESSSESLKCGKLGNFSENSSIFELQLDLVHDHLPSILYGQGLYGQGLTIHPLWTRTYHPSFMVCWWR